MPLLYARRYTRQMIRRHDSWLFVFGDNLARTGLAGQAAAARGEPNAVGIPTKRAPGMRPDDFFTDDDLTNWTVSASSEMLRLVIYIEEGGTVIWPFYGIGTGLADLSRRAPRIHDAIENFKELLEMKGSQEYR